MLWVSLSGAAELEVEVEGEEEAAVAAVINDSTYSGTRTTLVISWFVEETRSDFTLL